MGIADTIKGWFGSGKSTARTHGSQLSDTVTSGMNASKNKPESGMNKIDDGIDTAGRKMGDMTGGRADDTIDKGTDAAKDTIDRMGKQNP